MLRMFAESALRQDVWRGHDFWEPMKWSHGDLKNVQATILRGVDPKELEALKEHCDLHVWHRLCNLSSMYEELVREWFLPTVIAQLTSYPEQCPPQKAEV